MHIISILKCKKTQKIIILIRMIKSITEFMKWRTHHKKNQVIIIFKLMSNLIDKERMLKLNFFINKIMLINLNGVMIVVK
jgi:hypothetical protein